MSHCLTVLDVVQTLFRSKAYQTKQKNVYCRVGYDLMVLWKELQFMDLRDFAKNKVVKFNYLLRDITSLFPHICHLCICASTFDFCLIYHHN